MEKGPNQPTSKEIGEAESIMTDEEKELSADREALLSGGLALDLGVTLKFDDHDGPHFFDHRRGHHGEEIETFSDFWWADHTVGGNVEQEKHNNKSTVFRIARAELDNRIKKLDAQEGMWKNEERRKNILQTYRKFQDKVLKSGRNF